MRIEIQVVENKKQMEEFVKMQFHLYKGNPFFVPPIIHDELETFDCNKNPALRECESECYLAYDGKKIVGRIALIDNKPANKKWNTKNGRFSWIEFENNYDITEALLDKAVDWCRSRGLTSLSGPHGFTDLDPQGMLIEGFDKQATIAGFYHHPYYHTFIEKYGFQKQVDFVEFLSTPSYQEGIPEKMIRTSEWVKQRYNFKLLEYKTKKEYKKRGRELFKLLEESFEENFGTVPLNDKQIDYYIKKYISYINPELIKIVVDENDTMIGFMISMPSLSEAYKKSNGHLYPFGVFHMLKALKTYDVLDFYLAGVKKEYRGKGVDLIMAVSIAESAMKLGFKKAESNQELEENTKIQAQWKFFNPEQHKRRRIYTINL